jgi:hypothetical protein
MNNYTGRRKYKRIELEEWKYKEIVSPCITRFRVTQCDGQEASSLEWNIVAVKNLSAGGIMFNYYKMDLGLGSLLELKLDFIKSKPAISCIGRVVRIEDAHTNCMFRIATEFTEINDLDREIINTTVEAILKRETKKRIYPEKLLKMKNSLTRISGIVNAKATDISNREKALKGISYEPVGVSGADKLEDDKAEELSGMTEADWKDVSGKEANDCHARHRERTLKKGPVTAFIIAYMVLMLILGFLVHSDLSKQLNRVEARLDNVVSKVVYSGF